MIKLSLDFWLTKAPSSKVPHSSNHRCMCSKTLSTSTRWSKPPHPVLLSWMSSRSVRSVSLNHHLLCRQIFLVRLTKNKLKMRRPFCLRLKMFKFRMQSKSLSTNTMDNWLRLVSQSPRRSLRSLLKWRAQRAVQLWHSRLLFWQIRSCLLLSKPLKLLPQLKRFLLFLLQPRVLLKVLQSPNNLWKLPL